MILPTTNELLREIAIRYGVDVEAIEKSTEPETVRLLRALNLQLMILNAIAPLASISVIGGNVWVTNDVPGNSKIVQSKPRDNYYTEGGGI